MEYEQFARLFFYPPQQLPGFPQELGAPQHPPGIPGMEFWLEFAVLCADNSFSRCLLLQCLQHNSSAFPNTMNSLIEPQSSHLYSYIGIFASC
jgi:hypothetical protein